MKLYAPKYYTEFNCIADKCKHTCCAGWEIDIDSVSLEKYKCLLHGYSEKLLSSISEDETPHFNLTCGDRCPHLNEKGLCEIILNVGEDYLCDICREHPRFYNTANGCMYVGLGMACEEAARLILASDSYGEFVEIGETEGEERECSFDAVSACKEIFSLLSNRDLTYSEKLDRICSSFEVSPKTLADEAWKNVLSSLEYLDQSHQTLFDCYSSESDASGYENILERALAYFVFRHCIDVYDEYDFRESLGFCLFCERLLSSMLSFKKPNDEYEIARLARILSEELEYSEDNTETIMLEFESL